MSTQRKHVVRFDLHMDPAFDERLAREPDIDLTICSRNGPEEAGWTALERAHVYQISAARDELPPIWHASAELLQRCPTLLCVSSGGAGYDTVDVAACTKAGIAVVNQAGGNANSVAEHAFGLMLALSKKIIECDRRLRIEQGFSREDLMGHELGGKVLGIIGIGHVGTRVASLAHAFRMDVLATDPYLTEEEIGRRGATSVALEDLLARSDIVSVHCPRAKDTVGMINAHSLRRMKPGALFINTARGGIHDEAALFDALRSGQVAGAGLDVWEREPPPLDHPLLKLDRVIASFHTAGVTPEARRKLAANAAGQIVGTLKGGRPPRLVNPEVWPNYAARFEAALGIEVQVPATE